MALLGLFCPFTSLRRTTGEIDIIEFVNNVPNNLMALHTSPGCTVAGADETGTLISSDCGVGNIQTQISIFTDRALGQRRHDWLYRRCN